MTSTEVWTSTQAIDGYILLTGNIQSALISGVKSCSSIIVEQYDATNYRDEFYTINFNTGFPANIENMPAGDYLTEVADPSGTPSEKKVTIAAGLSGNDSVMHIPPRPELRKRTMLLFWNGAKDVSDVLASCWADEFRSFSKGIYTFAA